MWFSKRETVGKYLIHIMGLDTGEVIRVKPKQLNASAYTHQVGAIGLGSIEININEYSVTRTKGENLRFFPRAGLTPFDPGTIITYTAKEPTKYICVEHTDKIQTEFVSVAIDGTFYPPTGALVILNDMYSLNGQEKSVNDMFIANSGDNIQAVPGTLVFIYNSI